MNGVIYARYSEGHRQSVEGQVTDCLAYAKEYEITVIP